GLATQDLLADQRGTTTTDERMQAKVGNVFVGTDGYLVCSKYNDAVALNHDYEITKVFSGPDDHYGNFAKAVRSGRQSDLNAPIEEGHLSSALCHLGNISYRLGREMPFGSA